MNLLLLSASRCTGRDLLAHAREPIQQMFANVPTAVFLPFALADWDGYTEQYQEALSDVCEVRGAHNLGHRDLARCGGVIVGGGNTFRLVRSLHERELLDPIRGRVAEGAAYMGASAGSVVAGPTIRTTNDMPIVEPPSFASLDLVGFHLNCHYLDPELSPLGYMAETRDQRIAEFLEENDAEVVCLREDSWLRVTDESVTVEGASGGKYFRRGLTPLALAAGDVGVNSRTWGKPSV